MIFLQGQGLLHIGHGNFKYQESQGKVREFHNFGPKYLEFSRYFVYFMGLKMLIFFLARFTCSIFLKLYVNNRKFVPKTYFKQIVFHYGIGEIHFNELEKRFSHLSAVRSGQGQKNSVFRPGKSQAK